MSKVKIKQSIKYSTNGTNCISLNKGDTVENLPADIEKAWLNRGVCELVKVEQKETKVIAPVKEVKKQTRKRATKAKAKK